MLMDCDMYVPTVNVMTYLTVQRKKYKTSPLEAVVNVDNAMTRKSETFPVMTPNLAKGLLCRHDNDDFTAHTFASTRHSAGVEVPVAVEVQCRIMVKSGFNSLFWKFLKSLLTGKSAS